MRKTLFFTTLVLLLIVSSAAPVVAQGSKTELRLAWWGSQNRHDRTIKVIEMYEAANPNIDIVYEFSSFNDYWTKHTTQAAGGGLPCVMQHDYAFLADWAARKLLVPLDDYLKDGTINVADVAASALDGGRINGLLYGLNLGTNSQAFLLDAEAFEKAGIALPSPQWTWKEFEDIVLQLHEKLGIWGFGNGLPDEQLWKSLYLAHGTWAFSDDGTQLGYTDDQPLIDHFKMILRLQDAGAIPTQEESTEMAAVGPEGEPIVTGKGAMAYQWSNQVIAMWTAAGENRKIRLWHLPRPEGGRSANYIKPSMFFSLTSQCPSPEVAAEGAKFIDFFTNSLEANDILFAERGVPISSKVRDHLMPKLGVSQAEMFDFMKRVEADNTPIRPPDPPGWADIRNNIWTPQVVQPILFKQITPEEGVRILREEANLILAKNKK